jgi:tetratricopeptide (TPR) repeat protein
VPNFYEAHYALGQAYEKKGDKEKAKKAYEAALKYNPQYEQAKEALDKLKQL